MKQRPQSGGSQLWGLGIQKVGRERRESRVLALRIQLCHFEFRTTPNDAQRHDAAAYQMRTGTQNLLYPSTLSDPAASASGERRKPGSFQASPALPLLSRKRHIAARSECRCSLVVPSGDSQSTFGPKSPFMAALVRRLG